MQYSVCVTLASWIHKLKGSSSDSTSHREKGVKIPRTFAEAGPCKSNYADDHIKGVEYSQYEKEIFCKLVSSGYFLSFTVTTHL